MTVIGSIGLVLMFFTYMTFHRLAPKMDPMHVINADRNIQHGIPPKPAEISTVAVMMLATLMRKLVSCMSPA